MSAGTDASTEIYRAYEQARDWALASGDAAREGLGPGAYLLDASPRIVERLREHTHHLGGAAHGRGDPPPDARGSDDEKARVRLLERLAALVDVGGMELLVSEPALLGGSGVEVDGALYNEDTLTFYETVVVLDRCGVLPELRDARGDRPIVWMPAPGWGGLAYQLKTLTPRIRCVLSDEPARLIAAAVYLRAAFPDARARFLEAGEAGSSSAGPEPLEDALEDADFVFAPAVDAAAAPARGVGSTAGATDDPTGATDGPEAQSPQRFELTVSLGAFARMALGEVESHVARAWKLGSRYLYDGAPRGLGPPDDAQARRAAIERRFWLHETPVRPSWATELPASSDDGKRRATFAELGPPPPFSLEHTLGWRRIIPPGDDA